MFRLNQLVGFGVGGAYSLINSLNLNGSNQFIQRSSIGSLHQTIATNSCWVKKAVLATRGVWFATGTAGAQPGVQQELDNSGSNAFTSFGFNGRWSRVSTLLLADNNWHHVCEVYNMGGTLGQRVRIYVDGTEVTYSGGATSGEPNVSESYCNATDTHTWGNKPSISAYWNGKIADIHFINGQALTPSAFIDGSGAGACHPKKYTGSFGTGSYHLGFNDANLNDDSGNALNFTGTGSPTFSTDVPI